MTLANNIVDTVTRFVVDVIYVTAVVVAASLLLNLFVAPLLIAVV